MSRRTPLLACFSTIALLATGSLLRADDPPAPTPPPGYKVVYHDVGNGKKAPIFVKDQDDLSGIARRVEDDPLDSHKVFSETNPESSKTFMPETVSVDKATGIDSQEKFTTKVYDTSGPGNVYDVGSKPTYHTASFDGTKAATGYDQSFQTKSAPPDLDQAAKAFAPIGAPEQNRAAPIDAKTYDTFADPESDKKFSGPEEDARHKKLTRLNNGQLLVEDIPDRPLTVDEVRDLINHGFKPDLNQPAPPASKPLNDPDYQPKPLRIEPTSADDEAPPPYTPAPGALKVQDDDANDPVPSPGTMAEPPENSEPLPNK